MFTLEWRELLFLAAVVAFWLYTLKWIYEWWVHGRSLQPQCVTNAPRP